MTSVHNTIVLLLAFIQVYLLTLVDRTTLSHAQSTISCCTQIWTLSVITRQQASVDIESTLLHRPIAVGC